MHSGVLFGLTVLLGHLCVCSGVKCYSCTYTTTFTSASTSDCNEGANFNGGNLTANSKITECTGKCSKARAAVAGSVTITRGCMGSCAEVHAMSNGLYCCTTDYCNDTYRMTASLVGALASVLAAFLFRA